MTGLELAFALMGLTAGAILGLRVGVLTEATRTRELRRVFRQRLRSSRQGVASPSRSPRPVPSAAEPEPMPGDEGSHGAEAPADAFSFGLAG